MRKLLAFELIPYLPNDILLISDYINRKTQKPTFAIVVTDTKVFTQAIEKLTENTLKNAHSEMMDDDDDTLNTLTIISILEKLQNNPLSKFNQDTYQNKIAIY